MTNRVRLEPITLPGGEDLERKPLPAPVWKNPNAESAPEAEPKVEKTEENVLPFETYMIGDPATEPDDIPPPPLVKGLVPSGFSLLAGVPKGSRKTMFAIYLALCLSDGLPFFGRPTRKQRVLFIQRDMGRPWFLDYVRAIRAGTGMPRVTPFPVVSVPMDLMTDADRARLFATIEKHSIETVIIDSSRSTSNVEENNSEEVKKITRDLCCDKLRDTYGVSIILVAHPAKNGFGARGSGEWFGGSDAQLVFSPAQDRQYIEIEGEGRCPGIEFAFRTEIQTEPDNDRIVSVKLIEVSDEERSRAAEDGDEKKLRALARALLDTRDKHPVCKSALVARAKAKFGLKLKSGKEVELLAKLQDAFKESVAQTDGANNRCDSSIVNVPAFQREYRTRFPQFGHEVAVIPESGENDQPEEDRKW